MEDSTPIIIPDSEIENLRLRIAIRGVSYRRNGDGQAGVVVLLEANFVLPDGKCVGKFPGLSRYSNDSNGTLEYARLPFETSPVRENALELYVEAITPDGDEVACLGIYTKEITKNRAPDVKISAAQIGFRCSNLGNTTHTTEEAHQHILLTGYRGITGYSGTRPHWEFSNPLRIYYPKQIFLLAQFSSNHPNDTPFPFVLRFNSNCQITLVDRLLNAWKHLIGVPNQRVEFRINGRFREAEVQKYEEQQMVGIVAAVRKAFGTVSNYETLFFIYLSTYLLIPLFQAHSEGQAVPQNIMMDVDDP